VDDDEDVLHDVVYAGGRNPKSACVPPDEIEVFIVDLR
jgi:hypothetical protein